MPGAKSKPSRTRKRHRRGKRLPKAPGGGIELLLVQSVEHLGNQGEVVVVRPGYANNFLLPQGLATDDTEHHKRRVDKHRARLQEIHKARLAGLQAIADKLGHQSLTIEANANEEGHLYGSVGPNDIVSALKANNITITPDQIRLKGPLKELGLYTVKVHVGQEIDAELKVWVVPLVADQKGDQSPSPEAEPK